MIYTGLKIAKLKNSYRLFNVFGNKAKTISYQPIKRPYHPSG